MTKRNFNRLCEGILKSNNKKNTQTTMLLYIGLKSRRRTKNYEGGNSFVRAVSIK